jgi:hypothetical protein
MWSSIVKGRAEENEQVVVVDFELGVVGQELWRWEEAQITVLTGEILVKLESVAECDSSQQAPNVVAGR